MSRIEWCGRLRLIQTDKKHGKENNMKIKTALTMLALGASAFIVNAQDAGDLPPDGNGPSGCPPPSPVIVALDANHDGVISAYEITNAPAALKTLDKNGDGQLTQDELRPQGPPPQQK
jgi:hypothetical protein